MRIEELLEKARAVDPFSRSGLAMQRALHNYLGGDYALAYWKPKIEMAYTDSIRHWQNNRRRKLSPWWHASRIVRDPQAAPIYTAEYAAQACALLLPESVGIRAISLPDLCALIITDPEAGRFMRMAQSTPERATAP